MSREWKPGDVALVNDCTRPDADWMPATCQASKTVEREAVWLLHGNGSRVWGSVTKARPLVVIDPEDRDQVERLRSAVSHSTETFVEAWQAALRSLITPPRPEEPTGKYAIVVADGVTWCRAAWASEKPWSRIGTEVFSAWDEMAVESVEFEGVTQ